MVIRCPVCKAENSQGPTCRRCKGDLSLLFALENKRALALQSTRERLAHRRWGEARLLALRVDHLRQDAESRQLLALTALLCGDYFEALRLHKQLSAPNGGQFPSD